MNIESYALEEWHSPHGDTKTLYASASGSPIGIIGSSLDTEKMIHHAKTVGGELVKNALGDDLRQWCGWKLPGVR